MEKFWHVVEMPHTFRFSDEKEVESFGFVQRSLYVDEVSRPIDRSTIPRDGTEYIHLVRLVDSDLSFDGSPCSNPPNPTKKKGAGTVEKFKTYASALQKDKETLKKKFPKVIPTPENDEREWCMFCLGRELCSKIYETEDDQASSLGHSPSLSIVVHLSQTMVIQLLEYQLTWFTRIGMHGEIGEWVYALLACLENRDTAEVGEVVDKYCFFYEAYLENSEESNLPVVEFIFKILKKCFM